MPIDNLNSHHFNSEEQTEIITKLKELSNLLKNSFVNLTPEERQKYGKVAEQNKLLIKKVYDYHRRQPELDSPDVDWQEFEKDFQSRQFLEDLIGQLSSATKSLINAKTLHDWDNYQNALTDYSYAKYKASTSQASYENKAKDIKQFFNRTGTSNTTSLDEVAPQEDIETP